MAGVECILKATEVAVSSKLYGAGQDLLSDAFSGNIKGLAQALRKWSLKKGLLNPL